jgi:hypothetical protein
MSKRIMRVKKLARLFGSSGFKMLLFGLVLILLGAGIGAMRGAVGINALKRFLAPSATTESTQLGNFSPQNPSKEYVYAGGRLIAIEEFVTPSSVGMVPEGFAARTASTLHVELTWRPPPAPVGTVGRYEIERSERLNDPCTLNKTCTVFQTTNSNFTDTTALREKTYLYRVRAVYSSGAVSSYSNRDLATIISFTDDPIVPIKDPQGRSASTIRAVHLTELQRAVDAVRSAAELPAAPWKNDPSVRLGGLILAAHYIELRNNLNPALTKLSITTLPTDDGISIGQSVKAAHVQDVRERVR